MSERFVAEKTRNLHQFDCYLKKTLANYAKSLKKQKSRISNNEVPLDEYLHNYADQLFHYDTYASQTQVLYPCGQPLYIQSERLWVLLSQLSCKEQELLYLYYCENMTDQNIALKFFITANAVKKRRQRILNKLRKQAANGGPDYGK